MSCKSKEIREHLKGPGKSILLIRNQKFGKNKNNNTGPKDKPETDIEKIKTKKKSGEKKIPKYLRDQNAA